MNQQKGGFVRTQRTPPRSAPAHQVCPCKDETPSCNISELHKEICPGELLQIPVVTVGQKNGVIPAAIQAFFIGNPMLAQF